MAFIPPKTFAEFVERYPDVVPKLVSRVCWQSSTEGKEDTVSSTYIAMMEKEIVEKYDLRKRNLTNRVLPDSDQERMFLGYIHTCIRRIVFTSLTRKPDAVELQTDIHHIPGTTHRGGETRAAGRRGAESVFDALRLDESIAKMEAEEARLLYVQFEEYIARKVPDLLEALHNWYNEENFVIDKLKRYRLRTQYFAMLGEKTPRRPQEESIPHPSRRINQHVLFPKLVKCVDKGMTAAAAAHHTGYSVSTVRKTWKLATGDPYPVFARRRLLTLDGEKMCACGETRLSQFSKCVGRKDGLQIYCRTCNKREKERWLKEKSR